MSRIDLSLPSARAVCSTVCPRWISLTATSTPIHERDRKRCASIHSKQSQSPLKAWLYLIISVIWLPLQCPPVVAQETPQRPYLAGQVVDVSGQPLSGGHVFWNPPGARNYERLTSIGQDGKFLSEIDSEQLGYKTHLVVRHADRIGFRIAYDFRFANDSPDEGENVITLSPTTRCEISLTDQQGQPVTNAKVRMTRAWLFDWQPLDKLLSENMHATFLDVLNRTSKTRVYAPQFDDFGLLSQAVTNEEGIAIVEGLPADALVQLLIVGERITAQEIFMRTDGGAAVDVPFSKTNPNSDRQKFYSQEIHLTAAPSIPVRGTVTNLVTQEPLAGADVRFFYLRRGGIIVDTADYRFAVTDEQGRYELLGLPISRTRIYVDPPAGEAPLLAVGRTSNQKAGMQEERLDFLVPTGIQVTGKVLDAKTKVPIEGSVSYYSLRDNPAAKQMAPARLSADATSAVINQDGSYEINALPGPGLLTASLRGTYIRGQGIEQFETKLIDKTGGLRTIPAYPHSVTVENEEYLQPIHPKIGEKHVEINLNVPGPEVTIPLEFYTETKQRFSQVYFTGETTETLPFSLAFTGYRQAERPANVHFFVSQNDQRRLVQARTSDHKLAGWMFVTRDQKQARLELYPSATIVGRIIQKDGSPVVGAWIRNDYWNDASLKKGYLVSQPDSGYTIYTDKKGQFKIIGLPADLPLTGTVNTKGKSYSSTLRGYAFRDLELKRGETTDIGDLVLEELEQIKPQ